jgi:hypothetical protein
MLAGPVDGPPTPRDAEPSARLRQPAGGARS